MYVRNSHYSTHGVKYIPSHHDCYCSFFLPVVSYSETTLYGCGFIGCLFVFGWSSSIASE